MQLTLSTGRTITVTPPTGMARIKAQHEFGKRFKALGTVQPTEPEAQRKVIIRVAWALARYTNATPAELVEAFMEYPDDAGVVAQVALTGQVET